MLLGLLVGIGLRKVQKDGGDESQSSPMFRWACSLPFFPVAASKLCSTFSKRGYFFIMYLRFTALKSCLCPFSSSCGFKSLDSKDTIFFGRTSEAGNQEFDTLTINKFASEIWPQKSQPRLCPFYSIRQSCGFNPLDVRGHRPRLLMPDRLQRLEITSLTP